MDKTILTIIIKIQRQKKLNFLIQNQYLSLFVKYVVNLKLFMNLKKYNIASMSLKIQRLNIFADYISIHFENKIQIIQYYKDNQLKYYVYLQQISHTFLIFNKMQQDFPIPRWILCPIKLHYGKTGEAAIMKNPIITQHGSSYQQQDYAQYQGNNGPTKDFKTGKTFEKYSKTPNTNLTECIPDYLALRITAMKQKQQLDTWQQKTCQNQQKFRNLQRINEDLKRQLEEYQIQNNKLKNKIRLYQYAVVIFFCIFVCFWASSYIKEMHQNTKEDRREEFLKKMHKNVIGWNSAILSVDDWKKNKKLEEIQDLNLDSTNLGFIPAQLSFFPNLKRLSLRNNHIYNIQNLDSLTKLTILWLNGNHITQFQGVDNLTHLQQFRLGGNKITEIKGLDKLTNLQILGLASNMITEIKGLQNLTNLHTIVLSNNKIKNIGNLDHLSKLKNLYLANNPLQKNENTINYFKKIKENGLKQLQLPKDWNI